MSFPSEVGLRLVFWPLGSNIVVRTACCSIGSILPVYSTFKAIEKKDRNEQEKWLLYWAVYGSFSLVEVFADKILSWVPLYYHVKFAFLVWLQLPSADGAKQLYTNHLRPLLLKHQARLDQIVELLYREMSKFVDSHQAEIEFTRSYLLKIIAAARQTIRDVTHPAQRPSNRLIEGPPRQIPDAEQQPLSEAELED